ncbi:MAG: DUF255 domain-containing protein [Ignavibacteriales bacterium]|nr:MAG: DUF255 domain-containing protein [Ignavibacteriales bacterium]
MKYFIFTAVIFLMLAGDSFSQNKQGFTLPEKFDPARNAAEDIQQTINLAKQYGKRILLDVGGEWCIWCHRLDAFIESHKELKD